MRRLDEIPIRIEGPGLPGGPTPAEAPAPSSGGLGGGVSAILAELASLLERLAASQATAAIDLRSLPMSPQERSELQRILGEGEVRATVNANGLSTLREASFSGLWWVTHCDAQGEVIAEFLEVTRVPELLASAPDEIAAASSALRERLSRGLPPPSGRA